MTSIFKRKSIKSKLSIRDVRHLRLRSHIPFLYRYYAMKKFREMSWRHWDWTCDWKYRTMIDAATEIDNRPKNVDYNYDKRRN